MNLPQRPRRRRSSPRPPWSIYTPIITWTVIVGYTVLALGMTLQPSRFSRTPSYGNLVQLFPIQLWGAAYLVVAALLLAWRVTDRRSLGVFAHTVALILTMWWWGAFVLRWSTDNSTTIVNPVTWGWALSFVLRSAVGLDEQHECPNGGESEH